MVCSVQGCSDTEWHLGYVLMVDIPPWETCRWLILQQEQSLKANPKAAVGRGSLWIGAGGVCSRAGSGRAGLTENSIEGSLHTYAKKFGRS